ncbi:cation diffusion facilitator family transporter [Thiohalorhabdus sp. Cl-TMA]|uniref:Cation diffusion facilitator family transporter n=1 Tax=Thiohalorhabdus methylotrophus TaxID=3242694 RepID=A0ABV4TZE5_9GAMM
MGAQHSHGHDHDHGAGNDRRLLWALALTLGFAAVEAVGGWLSGSLALLGDAGHMLTDSVSLGLAALAARVARKPPTTRHSFGLGRVEVLTALVNGVFMLAVVGGIAVAALERFAHPQEVAGGMVLVVAGLGLLVNLGAAWLLHGGEGLNVRGAMLHIMGDLLGSVAALTSGAVILLTGWMPIDPILSLLICALILFASFNLLREGLHVLMEGVPPHLDLPEVGRTLAAVEGVHSVHDLHIWVPDSGMTALSAHVVVQDLKDWEVLLDRLHNVLRREFNIEHATLQPEPLNKPLHHMTLDAAPHTGSTLE